MDNLISVNIPTYNLATMLVNYCVPSVLNQTYQNFEIVVVGDGCSDNTEELLKTTFNDPRIKFGNLTEHIYYRHGIVGIDASNRALDLTSGDWSARLNDDCVFTPEHLEILLDFALKNNHNFVYGIQHGIGNGGFGCGDVGHSATMYDFRVFGSLRYTYKDNVGDAAIRERMKATDKLSYGFIKKDITQPAPKSDEWYKRNLECYGVPTGGRCEWDTGGMKRRS